MTIRDKISNVAARPCSGAKCAILVQFYHRAVVITRIPALGIFDGFLFGSQSGRLDIMSPRILFANASGIMAPEFLVGL